MPSYFIKLKKLLLLFGTERPIKGSLDHSKTLCVSGCRDLVNSVPHKEVIALGQDPTKIRLHTVIRARLQALLDLPTPKYNKLDNFEKQTYQSY